MFAYADKIVAPAHAPAARSPDREPSLRTQGPAAAQLAAAHRASRLRAAARAPTQSGDAMDRLAATGRALAGLPGRLKKGVEALSGLSMDDVRVHRNSPEPAALGALACTRGSEIHLGPGQEEHLPHEAWHVVQQKQGRVGATAQMKGMAVSEDHALEAEADRMGERAAGHRQSPDGPTLRSADAGQDVVQRKVDLLGVPLKEAGKSKLLIAYIKASKSYVLRDDFAKKLDAPVIHLIDSTKKYLLGEIHDQKGDIEGTSRWATETKEWGRIPKMFEQKSTMSAKDIGYFGASSWKKDREALEGVHARCLSNLIYIHQVVNFVTTNNTVALWNANSVDLGQAMEAGRAFLYDTEIQYKWYEKFSALASTVRGRPVNTPRHKKILAFSIAFTKTYLASLKKVDDLLKALSTPPDLTEKAFNDNIAALKTARGFLPSMGKELLEITDLKDKAEMTTLTGFLTSSQKKGPEILAATDPVRERPMVENIEAAKAPLLVKIGKEHVLNVSGKIASAIAVPWGESLEKHTKIPK